MLRILIREVYHGYKVGPKYKYMYFFKREFDWVLKQANRGEHSTHRRGKGTVNPEAESRNANSYWKLAEANNGFSPRHSVTLLGPWFWTSDLQNCEIINVFSFLYLFKIYFLFLPHCVACGTSPARVWTHTLCSGSAVLTTGPPGKSLNFYYFKPPSL